MNVLLIVVLTEAVTLLALVIVSLVLDPDLSSKGKASFRKFGRGIAIWAKQQLRQIKAVWGRTDVKPGWETNRSKILVQLVKQSRKAKYKEITDSTRQRARLTRQSRLQLFMRRQPMVAAPAAPLIDGAKIQADGQAEADAELAALLSYSPDSGAMFTAWTRRFVYTLLLIVMTTTDVAISVLRFEVLKFFTVPPGLQSILNNAFLLTPFALISSILLAKMVLDEKGSRLPPFVKLDPFEDGVQASIKNVLPYVVLILSLLNSLLLIYAAASVGSGQGGFPAYEFLLFVGLTLLTISAAYTGFTAILETFGLILAVLFLPVSAAIALLLAGVALMVSVLLGMLQKLGNNRLFRLAGRIIPVPSPLPPEPSVARPEGVILLGLGTRGTQMAQETGIALRDLGKSLSRPKDLLLYADVWAPERRIHRDAQAQLLGLAPGQPEIPPGTENPLDEIQNALASAHGLDSPATATIVCLAGDDDVQLSLTALKRYEEDIRTSHSAHQVATQNPVRVLLIWMVSRQGQPQIATTASPLTQYADDLKAWASEPSSILAGTIVIRDDSSLVIEASRQELLIARAIASFILSSRYGTSLSLEKIARQLKTSGCAFAALAVGTIGIGSLVLDIDGQRHGVMDESLLSVRLKYLMRRFFENRLTSIHQQPKPTSVAKFVTVLSPQSRAPRPDVPGGSANVVLTPPRGVLREKMAKWMTGTEFAIDVNNVTLIKADLSPKIDLSVTFADLSGEAHPQLSLIYTLDQGTVVA